jgi:hypothetical protein
MVGQHEQGLEIVTNTTERPGGGWLVVVGFNDRDLLADVESVTYEVITNDNCEKKEVGLKKDFFEREFVVRDLAKYQIRTEVRLKGGEIVPVLIDLNMGARSIRVVRSGAESGSEERRRMVAMNKPGWKDGKDKVGTNEDDGRDIPKLIAPRRDRISMPPGMFYVVVLCVIMVLIAVIAMKIPWYVLPIVIIGGLLSLVIIGAFRLREDEKLSQSNFLMLLIESFKRMPLLKNIISRKTLPETKEQEVVSHSETGKRPEVTDRKSLITFVNGKRKKLGDEVRETSGEKDGASEKTE